MWPAELRLSVQWHNVKLGLDVDHNIYIITLPVLSGRAVQGAAILYDWLVLCQHDKVSYLATLKTCKQPVSYVRMARKAQYVAVMCSNFFTCWQDKVSRVPTLKAWTQTSLVTVPVQDRWCSVQLALSPLCLPTYWPVDSLAPTTWRISTNCLQPSSVGVSHAHVRNSITGKYIYYEWVHTHLCVSKCT